MLTGERIVLDTHALLWWQADEDRLSERASAAISEADTLCLCPITFWEVGMLAAKGRIGLDRPVVEWCRDMGNDPRVDVLDLLAQIAGRAGADAGLHGDPADRLIYATAAHHSLALVTKDHQLTSHAERTGEVSIIW